MLFSLVAEQNVELMQEIINLKKGVKEVLHQFTHDVEDHMNEIKDDVKNQNIQTANALKVLTREVIKLQERNPSPSNASGSPTLSTSTSKNSSPIPPASKPLTSAARASAPVPKVVQSKTANRESSSHKKGNKAKTAYQLKPKVLLGEDSLAQKLNFGLTEVVTNTTIRTAKGYSSAWDNLCFQRQ